MNNYDFCVDWVRSHSHGTELRVLDFGCGAGQIVTRLRLNGVNAFGCDVFYEGGDFSSKVDGELFGTAIKRMDENGAIPFEDASFDLILSNMVMEHVVDLNAALAEIERVCKPGGMVLSLFPDKGVWREGHCGIAFLHWFPKGSKLRVVYAAGVRLLGFGYHKGDKSAWRWSRDFCDWLDKWTSYRTREEIVAAYGLHLIDWEDIEVKWLSHRFGKWSKVAENFPRWLQEQFVRKFGCMVFTVRKWPERAGSVDS